MQRKRSRKLPKAETEFWSNIDGVDDVEKLGEAVKEGIRLQ